MRHGQQHYFSKELTLDYHDISTKKPKSYKLVMVIRSNANTPKKKRQEQVLLSSALV